jgi:hypothetical protein
MRARLGSALFFLAAAGAHAGDGIPAITVYGSGSAPDRRYSVEERLAQFGPDVRRRLSGLFAEAGLTYPPREVTYVAFKDVRHLEVYARNGSSDPWRFIKDYRIRGASGTLGPKLAEGDRQVPEGIYRADSLNPNSRYHLSIRLNYPNAYDREVARRDGRDHLGGDIMIHGSRVSDGCLAMGDEAVEDLFVLAALIGEPHVRIVISPTDFRDPTSRVPGIVLPWLRDLYLALRTELQQYPSQHGRR